MFRHKNDIDKLNKYTINCLVAEGGLRRSIVFVNAYKSYFSQLSMD